MDNNSPLGTIHKNAATDVRYQLCLAEEDLPPHVLLMDGSTEHSKVVANGKMPTGICYQHTDSVVSKGSYFWAQIDGQVTVNDPPGQSITYFNVERIAYFGGWS